MQLRPYQREAIDALYAWWADGGGNALIDLATGCGKSLLAATLCRELLARWPGLRIGVVTHVKELLQQNAQELLGIWPQAPIGIYSAGLGRRDRSQILFAGIQSAWNKALGHFDLLLIDEAHLIPKSADTRYGRFIASCREQVPDMRIVGLTATPYRLDSGRLDQGEGALFDRVIYTYGIADGVRDGYLAPLMNKATGATVSVEGVKTRGGEYVAESLQAKVLESGVIPEAVAEMVRRGQDRRGWLVFCCGVKDAAAVRDEVRRQGISCAMVSGETPAVERDSIIRAYKRQEIRCLTNVNVLTTGFNAPHVDLLAWLRPTLSTGLYIQGMGRGTRLAPGKADCLVLDFAGNIRRHGPVDMIEVRGDDAGAAKRDKKDAPVKVCPECESYNHASAARCRDCGHVFPAWQEPKYEAQTDDSVPVMTTMPPQWVDCSAIACKVHNAGRDDKLPTLQVDYLCGITWHKEWLCFDHEGFARKKAERSWSDLGGSLPVPASVEAAYQRRYELAAPAAILVKPEGRFWRVLARRMKQEEAVA